MQDLLNTTFSSLQVRNYRWYWISTLASYAGMQMDMVVRGWLIFQMTGSALALGIVSLASGVPIVVISVFSGAIADRVHKRNTLILFQSGAAVIALTIAALIATGSIQWWYFIIAAILQGIIFSFIAPLRQALIPELVERRYLLNAVALGSASLNIMRIAGPSLAGILLAIIGSAMTYGIITMNYGIEQSCCFLFPYSSQQVSKNPPYSRILPRDSSSYGGTVIFCFYLSSRLSLPYSGCPIFI